MVGGNEDGALLDEFFLSDHAVVEEGSGGGFEEGVAEPVGSPHDFRFVN